MQSNRLGNELADLKLEEATYFALASSSSRFFSSKDFFMTWYHFLKSNHGLSGEKKKKLTIINQISHIVTMHIVHGNPHSLTRLNIHVTTPEITDGLAVSGL